MAQLTIVVLFISAVVLTISIPTPAWVHVANNTRGTTGLFYVCPHAPTNCVRVSTSQLSACAADTHNKPAVIQACQYNLGEQGMGLLTILFSWIAALIYTLTARPKLAGIFMAFAFLSGLTTTLLFAYEISSATGKSWSASVAQGTYDWGYGFALVLFGILVQALALVFTLIWGKPQGELTPSNYN